jgi:hypothetical protein
VRVIRKASYKRLPVPVQGPLGDEQAAALERYEHALDCDKTDHSGCEIDEP